MADSVHKLCGLHERQIHANLAKICGRKEKVVTLS